METSHIQEPFTASLPLRAISSLRLASSLSVLRLWSFALNFFNTSKQQETKVSACRDYRTRIRYHVWFLFIGFESHKRLLPSSLCCLPLDSQLFYLLLCATGTGEAKIPALWIPVPMIAVEGKMARLD